MLLGFGACSGLDNTDGSNNSVNGTDTTAEYRKHRHQYVPTPTTDPTPTPNPVPTPTPDPVPPAVQFSDSNPFGYPPIYVEGSSLSHFDTSNTLISIFPANVFGPTASGYNFQSHLSPSKTKTLTYEVMFAPDFNFVKGGKLPGLCGGSGASGGNPATGTNGFSARIMWRTGGRIVSYVYHVGQASQYGDDFQWLDASSNSAYFSKGVWQKVKSVVTMNDVGSSNGSIRTYFNDVLAFQKTNFVFRTVSTINVDTLCFNTFFGGDDSTWAPTKKETLYIRNLKIE